MSIDNNNMYWASSISTQTVTPINNKMDISIISNDQNLLEFLTRNNFWPDSTPQKFPLDKTTAYKEYTDGYSLGVKVILFPLLGIIPGSNNGFCLFNSLYADCVVIECFDTCNTGSTPT